MKKKFKIKSIEDIALQFIKHNEPKKQEIISNDTIVDSKFFVKKYLNSKKSNSSLSQSFEKLIPCEDIKEVDKNNKVKLIKFYKVPQKILGEEDEYIFDSINGSDKKSSVSKIVSQNTLKLIANGEIKLREIKPIKYNKKLYFNINYQNAYDVIAQIYIPLLQYLETISSLKATTDNIMNRIEVFCSHNSIFELNQNNNVNNNTNTNNITEIMEELKIFEIVEFSLILFILHIILEAKMEYMDNFNEDDILVVYQDSYSILLKIYEIIILMLCLNENNGNKKNTTNKKEETNNDNISFEALCSKYIK